MCRSFGCGEYSWAAGLQNGLSSVSSSVAPIHAVDITVDATLPSVLAYNLFSPSSASGNDLPATCRKVCFSLFSSWRCRAVTSLGRLHNPNSGILVVLLLTLNVGRFKKKWVCARCTDPSTFPYLRWREPETFRSFLLQIRRTPSTHRGRRQVDFWTSGCSAEAPLNLLTDFEICEPNATF